MFTCKYQILSTVKMTTNIIKSGGSFEQKLAKYSEGCAG